MLYSLYEYLNLLLSCCFIYYYTAAAAKIFIIAKCREKNI